MKNHFGEFDPKVLEVLKEAYNSDANSFAEGCDDTFDFKTCQRSDGTTYGTKGKCSQKGAKEVKNSKSKKSKSKGEVDVGSNGLISLSKCRGNWKLGANCNAYNQKRRLPHPEVGLPMRKKPKSKAETKKISQSVSSAGTPKKYDKYRGMKDPYTEERKKGYKPKHQQVIGNEFSTKYNDSFKRDVAISSQTPAEVMKIVDRMYEAKAKDPSKAKAANQWIQTADRYLDAAYKKPGRNAVDRQRAADLQAETNRQVPKTAAARNYRFAINKYGVNSPEAQEAGRAAQAQGVTPDMLMGGLGR